MKSAPKMPSATLKSDGVFERIIDGVKQQPDKAKSVNGVFLYNITSDGKQVKQWSKFLLIEMLIFFSYCLLNFLYIYSSRFEDTDCL